MANGNCQKIKLLKLMEILMHDTDENHPLSTSAICAKLCELGIKCERRTLYRDIDLLNQQGYEIMIDTVGRENGYYIEDRNFSVPEIKILIDAVQAACCITSKKSNELITKLAALGGSHRAEILTRNVVCFNTRKHTNESVYYNIGFLEDALCSHKMAEFYYFDLDVNGEKVYRKNKKLYCVEPVTMIYNDDNYYLLCYNSKYRNMVTYRIDRMDSVNVVDKAVSTDAIPNPDIITDYANQMFRMYAGDSRKITLEFDDSLIGSVYDRFGESISMKRIAEDRCKATVYVQVSPTFFGWVFQFAGKMRITAPSSVAAAFMEHLKAFIE